MFYKIATKSHQMFVLLLKVSLLRRTFKNCPNLVTLGRALMTTEREREIAEWVHRLAQTAMLLLHPTSFRVQVKTERSRWRVLLP